MNLNHQVMSDYINDIEKHHLLVRPSLTGGYWVSKFKGIKGLENSMAFCEGVIGEGDTVEEAINNWKEKEKQSQL